jgi:hypothetical protein
MSADQLHTARAEDILGQVRRQLRREVLFPRQHSAVRFYSGSPRVWNSGMARPSQANTSEELAEGLQVLYKSLDSGLAASTAEIGEMPEVPPTLRGAVGRIAIGILRRSMWWYTSPLKHFAQSVRTHLQGSTEIIEVLSCMLEMNRMEIAALREEIRLLREQQPDRTENRR